MVRTPNWLTRVLGPIFSKSEPSAVSDAGWPKTICRDWLAVLREDFPEAMVGCTQPEQAFDSIVTLMGMPEAQAIRLTDKRACIKSYCLRRLTAGQPDLVALILQKMRAAQGRRLAVVENSKRKNWSRAVKTESISRLADEYEHFTVLAGLPAKKFYATPEWRRLRLDVLQLSNYSCQLCGNSRKRGATLFVVHRKSRFVAPDLAFTMKNLRVVCTECRQGLKAQRAFESEEAKA